MRPIVMIEANEVPNQIMDYYAGRSSYFRRFLEQSDRYTTLAADKIQLDPWIAWPSLHRGVNDEKHRLLHLGQAPVEALSFPPIWELLRDAGRRVGVYGSLFSNLEPDPNSYEFFVPDVFSPHSKVNPAWLGAFQNYNLSMTRASARNASADIDSGGAKALTRLALSGVLSGKTLGRVAKQVVSERLDRRRLSRRRNIQTDLHGDVFMSLQRQTGTDFSTFYTNNVAAAMHRFWSAARPEESVNTDALDANWIAGYSDEVFHSMASLERLVRSVLSQRPDAILLVASSIGQEEIPAQNHSSFLTISAMDRFVRSVHGGSPTYDSLPTMVPDFTLRFAESMDADLLMSNLESLSLGPYRAIRTQERMHSKSVVGEGSRLEHIVHNYQDGHFKHPMTYSLSDERTVHLSVQIDDFSHSPLLRLGQRELTFDQAGLGEVVHQEGVNCTAQHSAEGSLIVFRGAGMSGRRRNANQEAISSLDLAPSILSYMDVEVPAHMQGEPRVALHSG